MGKTEPFSNAFGYLEKKQLIKLRLKAVRSGAWLRALQRIDRVLVDLTIRVTDHIQSSALAKCILAITRKLESSMESSLSRAFREVGLPLAQKISLIAQKLGNSLAKNWASDSSFGLFLAVLQIHKSNIYHTSTKT